MFIDEVTIYVKAGDGGNGCMAFRREKFIPRGGPSGGDGGHGGEVVLVSSEHHNTLLHLRFNPEHKAERGRHGEGSNRTGHDGASIQVSVPVGTVVHDAETGEVLHDFTRHEEKFVVARGGRGGRGNARFATSTHQAPREHEPGRPGEERRLRLELKLLADVGLVGFPNAGKSTLISRISAARPKIADYPFTTLEPQLGVVSVGDQRTFVVADIPGLIEGAHLGHGLGIQFLRHVERTRLLAHLVDVSAATGRDPVQDFGVVMARTGQLQRGAGGQAHVHRRRPRWTQRRTHARVEALRALAGERGLPFYASLQRDRRGYRAAEASHGSGGPVLGAREQRGVAYCAQQDCVETSAAGENSLARAKKFSWDRCL